MSCHARRLSGFVGISIRDDKIVIENAGRFPVRISPNALLHEEEEDRKNTSMPPNPVIANVMYFGGLIEHWGRFLIKPDTHS